MKYLAAIIGFMLAAMALSWGAVFSFWYAAFLFRSVAAVRVCDAIGSIILIPVRLLFWFAGDRVDQSIPLSSPGLYATMNAALLGLLAYLFFRRMLFGPDRDR